MTNTFVGSKDEYFELLERNFFNLCFGLDVLEIGPFGGHHSKLIINNKPKSFDVIEPNVIQDLADIKGINRIVSDDALLSLPSMNTYDVVVCFGVLYHLHSPIHLLELIVNYCQPKYILLDSVGIFNESNAELKFVDEEVNTPGNRYVRSNFKSSGLKLHCPGKVIQLAMSRLGYELVTSTDLNVSDWFPKSGSWLGIWKIKENQ